MKSGRGFVFTLEAGVSLLCLAVFAIALSGLVFEDLSKVVLYKQVSDYAQVVMKEGSLGDEVRMGELADALGLKVCVETENSTVMECPTSYVVVERTLVTEGLEYKKIRFLGGH